MIVVVAIDMVLFIETGEDGIYVLSIVKRLKELRICAFDQITHFLRFDVDL
jgi:hypothetical protein